MARQHTLIQDDAPAQPIDDPPAEIPGEPQPSPPHEPVPTPAPPPPAPVKAKLKLQSLELAEGEIIEIAPSDCRPPGVIADQSTIDRGVWARVKGEAWHKTSKSTSRAMNLLLKSETAAAGLKLLLEK